MGAFKIGGKNILYYGKNMGEVREIVWLCLDYMHHFDGSEIAQQTEIKSNISK